MKLKIKIAGLVLGLLLLTIFFGSGLKEIALNGIANGLSEYDCDGGGICTSCTINDTLCSCGEHVCDCGNITVNKTRCSLF